MAFNHEYPYVDPERYNSDWILNKMKVLEDAILGIEERILAASKEYIDEQLVPYQSQIDELKTDFASFKTEVNSTISTFTSQLTAQQAAYEKRVEAMLTLFANRIDLFRDELNADIASVNARTDLAIEQNNQYIFDTLTPQVWKSIRVRNYFTGEMVSVQDMFDYLAQLHVDNGATISDFETAAKTVNEIIAINATCTNWVMHGKTYLTA